MRLTRRALFAGALAPALLRPAEPYKISLAQWSLHRAIQSRLMTNLDFPRVAREQFGIEGLEFVNQLWGAPTESYVQRLKHNMRETGTTAVLIMCDGEGQMGHTERAARMRAVANHHKWVDIAAELGCMAIRTNMYPSEDPKTPAQVDAFLKSCVESFTALCEYAKARNINVLIENHGGISSNADVVVRLMRMVNLPNFGTLPDFGNFPPEVDKYESVRKLMAHAKAVSMKCGDFGADGKETTIDLDRMLEIVAAAGYRSWIGIEYEGTRLSEYEGIAAGARYLRSRLA